MNFSRLCISRPVFTTVMTLGLVLFGVVSFVRLPVREYPDIEYPVVSVTTQYPGAHAGLVETEVTKVLEESLAGIESLRTIRSMTREELSQITMEFELNRDLEAAVNDVRDRIMGTRRWLPPSVFEPLIYKSRSDAEPFIWLSLVSNRYTEMEMTEFAEQYLKDKLAAVPGVSAVWVWGARRYAMRIWIDAERLTARALTVQDVETAIRNQNLGIPSGRIQGQHLEFTVRTRGELFTPEHFNRLIIAYRQDYPIRLEDIGYAEIGAEDDRRLVRVDATPTVSLGVVKHSKANALDVARAVHTKFEDLQALVPQGMTLRLASDRSKHIERSLEEVYVTMGLAVCLVVLVIFCFLGQLRATVIPVVAIPASLLTTFLFMQLFGFSINLITLLGLVLAIGLVVDDAIIVLENIYRRIEAGQAPRSAAIEGTQEITFPVIATTISLAAIFIPIAFLTDATARLFSELALAVAASVLISGFIALTLTPMMSATMLKPAWRGSRGRLHAFTGRVLNGSVATYRRLLTSALAWRGPSVLSVGVIVVIGILVFRVLPSELAPLEDTSSFGVTMTAPEGATLAYTDHYAKQVEALYADVPEIESYFTWVATGWPVTSVNRAGSWVSLKEWSERSKSQKEIVAALATRMAAIPGIVATPYNPPSLGGGGGKTPVQFVISGPSYEELEKYVDVMLNRGKSNNGLIDITSDLDLNKPQLDIQIDREKAGDLGLSVDTVGRTLETLLGGRMVTRFTRNGTEYPVIIKVQDMHREKPSDIGSLYVRGHEDELVQLSNLVTVKPTTVPTVLNHHDKLRAATISAGLQPDYPLGKALEFLEETARAHLPPAASIDFAGQSKAYKEATKGIMLFFFMSLFVIYMVLAAQFESFVHPFAVLFSVPPALTGALIAIWGFGGSVNIYTEIGLIMLIGLVTKNAILIVDFANQLREQGHDLHAATIEASVRRLRPIMMTTLATILGALPLVLTTGAGAVGRSQLGYVIMAGMAFSTLYTLLVVPLSYIQLSNVGVTTIQDRRHEPDGRLSQPVTQQ